jgi:hypothetical protein
VQLRRRGRRALVASAAKLAAANAAYQKRQQEPWQYRALAQYDNIGEVRFCSQFYARMLSRVDFFPATLNADGKLEQIKDGLAPELLDRIQDPGGGRKRIQYDYGRLMFVTGEGILLGTGLDDEDHAHEKWRFLWRGEVHIDDQTGAATRRDSFGALTSETGTGYRMWTPHPMWSDRADSPMRAVLDIGEELLLLTAAVRSTAVSRVLKGLILVPSEIAPAPPEDGLDEDPELNVFTQKLIEHITAQIENPGSAEAQTPLYMEGGYDYLDRVRWVQLHDPATDYMEKDLRLEAIDRLALGLDLPPEALKGLSDANHWTGQQVKWDMWQTHGKPLADQFAMDLNDAYLRPALEKEGEDPTDIYIGYDDSQVVVSPDQTAVADEAMDRMAISFKGYRSMKGIPEDMAPSDEEQDFVFGLKTRDPVVAGLEKNAPPVAGPTAPPGVHQDQPGTPPAPTNGRVVSRQEARIASINGAAHMALRQCRSKAGARLRTATQEHRCSECQDSINGVPNAIVASVLTADGIADQLAAMSKRDPIQLVKGGTDDYRATLEEWGVPTASATVLCERIEAYAAATLFDPNTPDLPPGYTSYVEHALEMSDLAEAALA